MSKLQNVLSVITGVIELVFFSGLIFGWSSITYVLKEEGYFGYLCSSVNETNLTNLVILENRNEVTKEPKSMKQTCEFQDEALNLVFTIASCTLSVFTLPNGYIFDTFGTWICRIIAIFLFTFGAVMLSFISVQSSILLFPAMCCFAVGGILLLLSNMQLSNLFPQFKSSIITLMNGSLDSSSVVFLLVKLAYDSEIAFNTIFLIITFCTLYLWLRTFILMPRMHIPFPVPKDTYKYGLHDCTVLCNNTDSQDIILNESIQEEKRNFNVKEVNFWFCIKTWQFWTNFFHFSVLQLRNYFFFSSFYSWLVDIVLENQVNTYLTTFGICQFFGIICAPLNGMIIDAVKWVYKSKKPKTSLLLLSTSLSAFVTSTWGVLFSLCIVIPIPELQYVSFVLQVIFRSFLFGGNASFIALLFPSEHFGKLYGMTMTLGGIVSLLQFPFYSLVLRSFNGNFIIVNVIFLILCLLTYIHPIYLYIKSKKAENNFKNHDLAKEQVLIDKRNDVTLSE